MDFPAFILPCHTCFRFFRPATLLQTSFGRERATWVLSSREVPNADSFFQTRRNVRAWRLYHMGYVVHHHLSASACSILRIIAKNAKFRWPALSIKSGVQMEVNVVMEVAVMEYLSGATIRIAGQKSAGVRKFTSYHKFTLPQHLWNRWFKILTNKYDLMHVSENNLLKRCPRFLSGRFWTQFLFKRPERKQCRGPWPNISCKFPLML